MPRDAQRRSEPDLIATLRTESATRVVLVSGARLAGAHDRLRLVSPADLDLQHAASEAGAAPLEWFYLGRDEEASYLALALPPEATGVPIARTGSPDDRISADERVHAPTHGDDQWLSLRESGHLMSSRDAGLATTAVALASWRHRHRFCPRCGSATTLSEAGWSATCVQDASVHYPRTDPAVIMTVRDQNDRLLLARSSAWPENRRSVLAGFVEAGEGLESAVRREVAEEVHLTVDQVQYAGAQPWPFPGSLMMAFHSWVAAEGDGVPRPDGVEITHADFYTREDLSQAVRSGAIGVPMRTSIARALIESWYGGPLPERD